MGRLLSPLLLLLAALPEVAVAQSESSIGLGLGTVRFAGGSGLSVVSLTPAWRTMTPLLDVSANGALGALGSGTSVGDLNTALWRATPALWHRWRAAGEIDGSSTVRTGSGATGELHALFEGVWNRSGMGAAFGLGPSTGLIAGSAPVTALHTRVRGWWRVDSTTLAANLEPTFRSGAWFTDVSATIAVERGATTTSIWTGARASRRYGSSGAANVQVQWRAAPTVTMQLGGGSFLRDPYQGLPRAGFVTASVVLHRTRAPRSVNPLAALPPLAIRTSDGDVSFRFDVAADSSVAIAGDWNAWQPSPLERQGGRWAGTLHLAPGTYHFSLVVDGKTWTVPAGVPVVSDGMGGTVGVLVVNGKPFQ